MPRDRSPSSRAAGKLISEIQKAWGEDLGTDAAEAAEEVMGRAHDLLRLADSPRELLQQLGGRSCSAYLGAEWLKCHAVVLPAVQAFEHAAIDSVVANPGMS